MSMIPFNAPTSTGRELNYIKEVLSNGKFSGDGVYTGKCERWFESNVGTKRALLTPSCTAALEMAAILCDIEPGDEIIMPSFTFVSTANAFLLRGAKIVFVDIKPEDMNIDESLIEAAITEKTKAIVLVHYAGAPCEMDTIMNIAKKYKLFVIEDAAQAILTKYKGSYLGTIGDFGTISFHETKNIQCGEGGVLLVNNERHVERAEIIREKGTNRNMFFKGVVDKYTWVDIGSSYLPSELSSAYLYAQLEEAESIIAGRLNSWKHYETLMKSVATDISHSKVPLHNGHIFWIKARSCEERGRLLGFLNINNINAVFHYVPLHSTEFGKKHTRFSGKDVYTSNESDRLIRLPLWTGINCDDQRYVINKIIEFYKEQA